MSPGRGKRASNAACASASATAATLTVTGRPAEVVSVKGLPTCSLWSSANDFATMAPDIPNLGMTAFAPWSRPRSTVWPSAGGTPLTTTFVPDAFASSWRMAATLLTPATRATFLPTSAGTVSKPVLEVTT